MLSLGTPDYGGPKQCMKRPVAHSLNSTWFWIELPENCCEPLKFIMKYISIQFCERPGHGRPFHALPKTKQMASRYHSEKQNKSQLRTKTVEKRSFYTKCGSLAVKIMNGSHREICQDHNVISFENIFVWNMPKTKRFRTVIAQNLCTWIQVCVSLNSSTFLISTTYL